MQHIVSSKAKCQDNIYLGTWLSGKTQLNFYLRLSIRRAGTTQMDITELRAMMSMFRYIHLFNTLLHLRPSTFDHFFLKLIL